jgi:glycosyltransferase involved in cell wall biosynthesis
VRIGIDMLAVQSPHHGHRGIGRYGVNLVSTLLARDDEHEYVLYVHDDLPSQRVPSSPRATVRTIRPRWSQGETITPCMDRLARTNPDGLDVFLVLSPFEKWCLYGPPAKPQSELRMASVVHDLIPFLFQNESRVDPVLTRHYRVLEELTRYDLLLANSQATRRDVLAMTRMPENRVITIGAASDPSFFVPDMATTSPRATHRRLAELGISRPFVFNVGGLDPRKNTWTLIDAFGALPERLRNAYQLVLTFEISHWERGHIYDHARSLNLADAVVVTGAVSDETLRLLYQQARAFVFPSSYEGFGLPLLEAMHCGLPVIAGNNSSQLEVVGDAGLLVDVHDCNDLASSIARLLDDPILRGTLAERALARSFLFSWDRSAEMALDAMSAPIARHSTRRIRFDRGHSRKPTIAYFSPLPPRKSGISDYSASLLEELRHTYRIDLFHETGYVPEPALTSPEFMACDHGLFERFASAKDYHAIVYQMGNSRYHHFLYETMLRHPGLVTLHDFFLAGFHLHYGAKIGKGFSYLSEELLRWYPAERETVEGLAPTWTADWDAIARDCARRGWYMNRRVLDASVLTVVHSPWCAKQVARTTPQYADKVAVIPMGCHRGGHSLTRRSEVRSRFAIPENALVVGSFGFVHPDKLLKPALDAFHRIVEHDPGALYLLVGEEADLGEIRRHAAQIGVQERVRFLGRQPAAAFDELMFAIDIGVNLRMPPTNGETSAALLSLLAAGVPTVVTDVATFSDFPPEIVRKVRWETEGPEGLARVMLELATQRTAREALGSAALAHVERYHEWPRVAKLYVDAIEACHERTHRKRDRSRGQVAQDTDRDLIAIDEHSWKLATRLPRNGLTFAGPGET